MTLHVSISGVQKRVVGVWVGIGGVWKKVTTMHTSVVGSYKLFFSSGNIINPLPGGNLSAQSYVVDGIPNSAVAQFKFNANGTTTATAMDEEVVNTLIGQRWFSDVPDGAYEIYATVTSATGPGTTIGTTNSWVPLSSEPAFGAAKGVLTTGARIVQMKFKIRRASDGAIVSNDTNTYQFTANLFNDPGGGGGEPL